MDGIIHSTRAGPPSPADPPIRRGAALRVSELAFNDVIMALVALATAILRRVARILVECK